MALEISRLRVVVGKLIREKQGLKEALRADSETRATISQLNERDRKFKVALRKTIGALKTTLDSLEELIEQDAEIDRTSVSDALPMPADADVDSLKPAPHGVHVVEEGHFRWRPMRLLSDGTIEVDTPAGRFRFVDQFHVEEYFDAHWPLPEY